MKVFSLFGIILGIIGLALGLYNQFSLVPEVESLEMMEDAPGSYLYARMWSEAHSFSKLVGFITLILGGLGFLLSGIAALKLKSKAAIIGTVVGLIALFLGMLHGTHMF